MVLPSGAQFRLKLNGVGEIADLLDMPLSTVLNKYRRALQKLKKLLGESI